MNRIPLEGCEREQLIQELVDYNSEDVDEKELRRFYREAIQGSLEEMEDAELIEEYLGIRGALPFDCGGNEV